MFWEKLAHSKINKTIQEALAENMDFTNDTIIGLPGTYLDQEEFYDDAPFLKNAPFLSTLIKNPNHIGCHTFGESEPFFAGTQKLEKEVIHRNYVIE